MGLDKGQLLKSGSNVYKIVGDYSEVDSKIDYELKQIFPDTGKLVTTSKDELQDKISRDSVKIIEMNK